MKKAMKWLKDNWMLALVGFIVIIPVVWWLYKSVRLWWLKLTLPPDDKADYDAKPLAAKLFGVLDGLFTAAWTKEAVFEEVLGLTDRQLLLLDQAFKAKVLQENRNVETLHRWLKAEVNVSLGSNRDKIVSRLEALQLV